MRGFEDDQREAPRRGKTGKNKFGCEARDIIRVVCGHPTRSPQWQWGHEHGWVHL